MNVVLISTYEMGRQPFGLASPAAWLRARGQTVTCADLSVSPFPSAAIRNADLVAFYLPMHTATRMAGAVITKVHALNPEAHLAAYGLYAPLNREYLQDLGVLSILGGEFEAALADLADGLARGPRTAPESLIQLDRLTFITPDRSDLPELARYAQLSDGGSNRLVGYTEASRGCKHLCRHCPVVPVYNGAFRVVQREVVLSDIRSQVAAGARHITFGDPDFFNGPSHAMRLVEQLHREFPDVTYDATIKIEHLLAHRDALQHLVQTGCLFVTSAVESVDDAILEKLDKGHTRQSFYQAVTLCRSAGLTLNPTFIAFLPWTTRSGYIDLLRTIRDLDLIENVSPVQLALRLLITAGSRLLELPEIHEMAIRFNPQSLAWEWSHPDPEMDRLGREALATVNREQKQGRTRREIFCSLWELAAGTRLPDESSLIPRATVPYLNEPWYC